jgi:hypothetical protein
MATRPTLPVLVVGVLAVLGWSRGAAPPSGAPSGAPAGTASSQPAAARRGQPEGEGAAAAASPVHSGKGVAADARKKSKKSKKKGQDGKQGRNQPDGARPGDGKDGAGCTTKPRDAASGEAAARPPWCEPLRLYDEFLGLPPLEDLDRQAAIRRVRDALEPAATTGGAAQAQGYQLQFLIALVPDPLDSQVPAAFDQAIDAIQQGFAYSNRGRTGYLQDRSWIPWNDPQAIKEESYRTSPGLLLFRRYGQQAGLPGRVPQLTGVFLVGETPKTGIHKTAFAEALRLIGELSGGAVQGPLRILGPTYSGSAVSLQIALRNWLAEHSAARFEIVTGSATAPCLEKTLLLGGTRSVSFYRAVLPLDVLLETAFDELHRRLGWDPNRVLLITELDTAFGQSIRQRDTSPGEAHRKHEAAFGSGTTRRDTSAGAPAAGSEDCQAVPMREGVAVVSFPSHISAIRTARAAAGLDKQQTDPSQVAAQPARSELQLELADRRLGADLVPDFSPLTAPDNELAIASLVDAIARDGVRYVGVVATDIRDTLFLADRIRRLARNVTLFALDADQLFLHPQVHSALSGMTVISSSPLFTTAKSWGRGAAAHGDSPWHFTSSFENGIYQATVELLSDADLDPFAHNDTGPVWISVVGNDALWPVTGVTAAPDPGQSAVDEPERVVAFEDMVRSEQAEPADLPGPLAVASANGKADLELLCFAVALCAGGWWLYKAALLPAPPSGARAERGTRSLLAAGLAVLAVAAAVLLVASGLALWNRFYGSALDLALEWRQGGGFLALLFAYLLLVGAVGSALIGRRAAVGAHRRAQESVAGRVDAGRAAAGEATWRRRWLPAAGRATRWRLLLPAAGTLLAGAAAPPVLAWLICRRWLLGGTDFDQRVRAFASGLSPLVSLAWLVGGLFLWALLELKRRRLTAWQQIDWPVQDAFEPAFTGCSRLLGMIRWLLAAGFARSWWRWLALAVLVVAPLCLVWHPMQPAAEPRELGRLMLALWTLPAVLSAISCYRFVRVWRTLRKLLVRIESTPIAARLGQLSGELHWKPMQAFSWPIPPFETLILSLVKIKQLAKRRLLTLSDAQQEGLDRVLGLAFDADTRGDVTEEISSREELATFIADVSGQLALLRGNKRVEDFFAIRVAAYLRYVFAQLRNSLMSALGPALLVLVAASAYTFEPKGAVSLGLLALVVAEIVVAVSVFVAMNRDTVLSLIAGNRPGEVTFDWHFVSSVLTFGVVPLLGLIGTQVPAAGQLVNGWLKPLMRLAGVG